MEKSDIINHLTSYVKELSSETRLGTYSVPRLGRKGLLVEGSGKTTRGNTPWKVAQYIIAATTIDDKEDISQDINKYLDTWKSLMSGYGNQFLIIEVSEGNWRMYDWNANYLGDNLFIQNFIPEVYISLSSNSQTINVPIEDHISSHLSYLRAMRTKPFLLLAGISGTGKSRIVKQMAFDSCPEVGDLRKDPTSPGNYCLIEVKPNWHDSTELLGYESKIGGAHYQLTPFVKFLAKAMLYPEVPFFLCLDEMNLAPVEQYFAEFLSVLESRTKVGNHIVSEPLIKADIFANSEYKSQLKDDLFGLRLRRAESEGVEFIDGELTEDEQRVYDILSEKGLRIPENLVVIGTVNMDETTHQFSRKVIDRAMTIEMNLPEGDPFMDFFVNSSNLEYREEPSSASLYLSTEVRAADVIEILTSENAEETEALKQKVATFLKGLNEALDKTPFQVAYRVQNELVLYFYQLWLEDKSVAWSDILTNACDQILMMKVLPRIEGDEELLEEPLKRLSEFCQPYTNASKKLTFMTERLAQSRFASFWP